MLVIIVLLIFFLWMTHKTRTSERSVQKKSEEFWKLENKANSTRRQSLDAIPLITIPFDQLPILQNPSDNIAKFQKQIQELSTKPIANLSNQTNTELKLAYGAANLETLTEYDQNYMDLLRVLFQWGQELYKEERYNEAKAVLEFGTACKTDISKHYTLLAEIYKQENRFDQISDLIKIAEELDCLMKPAILRSLNEIFESCHVPE